MQEVFFNWAQIHILWKSAIKVTETQTGSSILDLKNSSCSYTKFGDLESLLPHNLNSSSLFCYDVLSLSLPRYISTCRYSSNFRLYRSCICPSHDSGMYLRRHSDVQVSIRLSKLSELRSNMHTFDLQCPLL